MKAAVCPELNQHLRVEEIALRDPEETEVVVRVRATPVCITDTLAIGGFTMVDRPFINGHAGAGVVEEVGSRVTRVRPGDRVVVAGSTECGSCFYCVRDQPAVCTEIIGGMVPSRAVGRRADGSAVYAEGGVGTWAERMIYREANLVSVESDLPFEHLALLGCGITSGLGAVFNLADVQPGSSVVVVGCGHLGLWMIQGARVAGAEQVIAVEPILSRRRLAGQLGASDLVDPADGDPVAQVQALTGGRGGDYVLEACGSTLGMEQGYLMTRPGGTFVPTSMDSPDAVVTLPAVAFALEARRVHPSQTGGSHLRRDIPRFIRMLEAGRIDAWPILTQTWRLEEINDGVAACRAREVLTGVVVP